MDRNQVEVYSFGKLHKDKDSISFNDEVFINNTGDHKLHQIKIWYNKN